MAKVAAGGVIATAVDVLVLKLLFEGLGVRLFVSAFLAAAAGAIAGFIANKFWAFRDSAPFAIKQVSAYGLVSLGTWTIVAVSVHVMHLFGAHYLMAKAIASTCVFLAWSYPLQARFVFAPARPIRPSA